VILLFLQEYSQARLYSAQPAVVSLLLLLAATPLALVFRTQRAEATVEAGAGSHMSPDNPQTSTEKESRTAAQKKIDSQLLYAIYQRRGQSKQNGTPTAPVRLRKDQKGRVFVDVRAAVNDKLVSQITKLGGAVTSRSERYHSILAYMPLGKIETLAESKDVKFIGPAAEPSTH
jgi:hypothetical protein